MPKLTDEPKQKKLTTDQEKLATLMTPVVQKYYASANCSNEEVKEILDANIQELQAFLEKTIIQQHRITDETKQKPLTARQEELATLMRSVVKEYYDSASHSKEETKEVLEANMPELQRFMGKILADIIIQQNRKIIEAVDEADKAPYCGY